MRKDEDGFEVCEECGGNVGAVKVEVGWEVPGGGDGYFAFALC